MEKYDVSIGDRDDKEEKPEERLPGQTPAAINVISAPNTTMDVKEVDVVWTSAQDQPEHQGDLEDGLSPRLPTIHDVNNAFKITKDGGRVRTQSEVRPRNWREEHTSEAGSEGNMIACKTGPSITQM